MLKKFLSVLLAVMMVVSVMAVSAVTTTAVTTDGFTPEATKLYFDVDGTGWEVGAKDKIAFYMAGGDFDTAANSTKPLDWGAKKLQGTAVAGETGVFEFDPVAKVGYTFTPGVQYKIIFALVQSNNWKLQTCSLFFTTDCFGHVAYSDGTEMENDVDSTKKSKTVYWRDIDPEVNGPVLAITSIGNVVGSCVEQGKTKEILFNEFISEAKDDFGGKTGLENARYYTVEQAKTKTEQQMIDDIGKDLGLTKVQVAEAFSTTGVITAWKEADSTLPASDVHEHTPADPVQENVTEADCENAGGYDSVVYCSVCKEEISREHVDVAAKGHTLKFVEKRDASDTENGMEAHYECTVCGKLFSDAEGKNEVTAEDLVIKAAHIRGDADGNKDFESIDVTVLQRWLAEYEVENFDETAADADKDGEVDIIDASLMQRVLAKMTTFEKWDEKHAKA